MKKKCEKFDYLLYSIFLVIMTIIVNIGFHFSYLELKKSDIKKSDMTYAYLGDGFTDSIFDEFAFQNQEPIFLDNHYASFYFNDLNMNFGNNAYGTCNYVAIGMILSFYDTYWDDDFIPEVYDMKTNFESTTQNLADFEFPPFGIESPGIAFESNNLVSNLSIDQYYEVINQYSNQYFHLKLLQLSQSYFGMIKFDQSTESLGMTYSEMIGFIYYYLYDYLSMKTSDVQINSENTSDEKIKDFTISKIENGIPVILRAKQQGNHAHSFVAYDYNKETDEIYVHTGWRREEVNIALTHVSLTELGYDELLDATTIEPLKNHIHTGNYHSSSGLNLCSCAYIFPQHAKVISGNYRDTIPTFEWKSLYKERWNNINDIYITFSILDFAKKEVFSISKLQQKNYALSRNQWEMILNLQEDYYYVYLRLDSDTYPYWDDYWSSTKFEKPDKYERKFTIQPSNYGFEDAYPTDLNTKENFISHFAVASNPTINDLLFETRRYRTGYIHNEYIVMSPIRLGINEAFIEYRFESAITRMDIELSHWRPYSNEWLNHDTGSACIQQFVGNKWITVLDLLSSTTNLPVDRSHPSIYTIEFERPAYRIRFYSCSYGNNTNQDNRGRICIGNITLFASEYNLPLSGYEQDYTPNSWNGFFRVRKNNCYSYALNAKKQGIMQPGGKKLKEEDYISSVLIDLITSDSEKYGFEFEPIDKHTPCPAGTYKVAIAIDVEKPEFDYHWYRQDSDGTWSHKPGEFPVSNRDGAGNIIFDPENCNRQCIYAPGTLNYKVFVGFFAISPLN